MDRIWNFEVDDRWEHKTVESFLKQHLGFTRRQISSLKFMENGILLNGQKARSTCLLRKSDRLSIRLSDRHRTAPQTSPAGSCNLPEPVILYEDDDLILADKAPGVPLHPSRGHRGDTLLEQIGGSGLLHPVGRLDKDTAGIVLFAKHRASAARLCLQLQKRQIEKTYLALAQGHFEERQGEITAAIRPKEGRLNQMEISPEGKSAVTYYQVLKNDSDHNLSFSLVSCRLGTGRTHQIRVHMASLGHPLLGDPIYGREPNPLFPDLGLCAFSCRLFQPFTKEPIQAVTRNKKWRTLWNESIHDTPKHG